MITEIYKICSVNEWEEACKQGIYSGSKVDIADGFIHFSTRQQLAATAEKHFYAQKNLILVEINLEQIANLELTWEPSRGGELFPHLYKELDVTGLEKTWILSIDERKIPILPF